MREAQDKLMLDEENSAHQFSLHDRSMQADSEERLEAEMQTSALQLMSANEQTSVQNAKSCNIQTSEIEMKSAKFQAFDKERQDMQCQTDPKMLAKPDPPKHMNVQTERYKDIQKNDWADSQVFKKALRDEAIKRGIETTHNGAECEVCKRAKPGEIVHGQHVHPASMMHVTSDEGETSYDSDRTHSVFSPVRANIHQATETQTGGDDVPTQMVNAQDPDTDIMTIQNGAKEDAYSNTGLGFLKSFKV